MTATKIANGTVVTVFVSNMTFLEPVHDCPARCLLVWRTALTLLTFRTFETIRT
jgi:acyl-CoA hydrolase